MELSSKSTNGPWEYNARFGEVRADAGGRTLAKLQDARDEYEWEESKANGRLMAAAPDLLEACEAAMTEFEAWEPLPPEKDTVSPVMQQLWAAIRKATGEGVE